MALDGGEGGRGRWMPITPAMTSKLSMSQVKVHVKNVFLHHMQSGLLISKVPTKQIS